MPAIIGQQAVVIGAGIAGLAAARALSDSFERVVLLERDTLAAEAMPRIGVPQGKQPHALLVGGLRALTANGARSDPGSWFEAGIRQSAD